MSTPPPSPSYIPGSIWPPDWSQFIPDAIGALGVGVAIGVFLWRFQRGSELRTAKRQAESHWKVQRAGLAGIMRADLPHTMPNAPVRLYTESWLPFLSALDQQVAVWADDSLGNHELQLARSMLVDLPRLERQSKRLRLRLHAHAVTRSLVDYSLSDAAADYFFLRVLTSDEDFHWMEIVMAKEHASWSELFVEVAALDDVSNEIAEFKSLQRRVESNWTELRSLLAK
jgi:hypothetical protein